VLQRLSKNDQDLQRNQQFANLAAEARRDLDAGDPTAARGRLSDIQKLGGNDENLAAEIARTERVRFGSLESEYQQDAQNTDERARNHLAELQRQFRVLAQGGGPMADKASNFAENLIPAKLADIAGKNAAAKNNATVADDQAFDAAVREYKKASEARDANSLNALALPKFQAIAQGNSLHKVEAAQYVEKLIPAAIREFAPYPAIGCAQVPPGLLPSIKPGDLVACGLLDQPRLKWVQFAWPEFPAQARQAGQTKGIAMLMLTVDQNGSVVDAKTRGRADAYGLSDAAIQAAKNWKTNPPRAQGKPVRTEFSVDLLFAQ
jgi:TonB family protein